MKTKVTWDTKSFKLGVVRALSAIEQATLKGVNDVGNEIMRLSSFEVPHDKGLLQASGHIEPDTSTSVIVGYNRVYASRLHEHPEYRFQKGRKGKYSEDPIKNNLLVFRHYMQDAINAELK
jgi:hypothetical protein